MRFFIVLCIASITSFTGMSQEVDTIFHPKQKIGFGIANLGRVIDVSLNNTNPFPKTTQYLLEYHHEMDTAVYIRFGASSAISSFKNGNLREYYFIPLAFNVGIEKTVTIHQFDFIYGADIFYTMSLRGGTQAVTGMWKGDDFGFGVAPITGIDYQLNKDWVIGMEVEIGIGLFRYFKNIGNLSVARFRGDFIQPRLLSLSFKYLLWNS